MRNVEIDKLTNEFCDVTDAHFEGYGYAAGYLSSLIATYFDRMPEDVQNQIRWALTNTTEMFAAKGPEGPKPF